MTEPKENLYRVEWTDDGLQDGVIDKYVCYVKATSELEATKGIFGTDFKVRVASFEEVEAYVSGYEDGYDFASVSERMKRNGGDYVSINIEDLE
jgi:hypothetical protein